MNPQNSIAPDSTENVPAGAASPQVDQPALRVGELAERLGDALTDGRVDPAQDHVADAALEASKSSRSRPLVGGSKSIGRVRSF